MTLRRFPWKAPRQSDNSYRLFVSEPDPDQQKQLDEHRRSVVEASKSEPASRNPTSTDDSHGHHRHHHHADNGVSKSETVSRQSTANVEPPTIKGPLRLLRLLPRETRYIIGKMLELDPAKRATMDEILADKWVQDALVCRQEEDGQILRAPGHTHTLQPSNASPSK